jgi:2-oxoglutarate dehydrogenase complex dehydrogenase (E1) component-like enzyme
LGFLLPRLLDLFPGKKLRYAGRAPHASPAVGSLKAFREEQDRIVRDALGL